MLAATEPGRISVRAFSFLRRFLSDRKGNLASVLKLVGMSTTFPVGAHTEVVWGNSRLRIALVLDNTGSMASAGKIGALQTASKNLIDQLKGIVVTPGDVYISIIPFARTVNA